MKKLWIAGAILGGTCVAVGALFAQQEAAKSQGPREVMVMFAASNTELPLDFGPVVPAMKVRLGEPATIQWRFNNLSDRMLDLQAVHRVEPQTADALFKKTVCFCFSRQTVKPRERKEMPVTFTVDPTLPSSVHTLTLGYTLYDLSPKK